MSLRKSIPIGVFGKPICINKSHFLAIALTTSILGANWTRWSNVTTTWLLGILSTMKLAVAYKRDISGQILNAYYNTCEPVRCVVPTRFRTLRARRRRGRICISISWRIWIYLFPEAVCKNILELWDMCIVTNEKNILEQSGATISLPFLFYSA